MTRYFKGINFVPLSVVCSCRRLTRIAYKERRRGSLGGGYKRRAASNIIARLILEFIFCPANRILNCRLAIYIRAPARQNRCSAVKKSERRERERERVTFTGRFLFIISQISPDLTARRNDLPIKRDILHNLPCRSACALCLLFSLSHPLFFIFFLAINHRRITEIFIPRSVNALTLTATLIHYRV